MVDEREAERSQEPIGILDVPMTAWLELFYDLVFVAAILVLSDAVSHLHDGVRVTRVVVVFSALWLVWLATTLFANRYRVQDFVHRMLVLAQMFLVALVAIEAHAGVEHDAASLAVTYTGLVGTVAIMYTRAAYHQTGGRVDTRFRAIVAWISSALFAVSIAVPWPGKTILWIAGATALVVSTFARGGLIGPTEDADIDPRHLVERMGAFTIIVCGEAFVKVAIAVSGSSLIEVDVVALFFQFVLTFAIWTSYFEDVPHAGIRRGRLYAWIVLHLFLQIAIAGTAIGVAKLVKIGPLDHLDAEEILEITGTLAGVYLALAGIGPCTRRLPTRPLLTLRLAAAFLVVVVGVSAWAIDSAELLEGVAALSVVAVVYAAFSYRMTARTEIAPLDA
ncbi:MAG TPA: low temperature requirement protein A [Acidimicrobiia bacterium]|jgi:low temperature requirement protein LtrA